MEEYLINHIWETHPDWNKLPTPCEGDIVHLKHISGFRYLVKVIVSSVTDNDVTGVVEAVFDWDTKGQITGGEIIGLVGKELTFQKNMMQNVIKKSARFK